MRENAAIGGSPEGFALPVDPDFTGGANPSGQPHYRQSPWLPRLLVLILCAGSAIAEGEPARTVKDIPLQDLRTMLKGYPGDWRLDSQLEQGLPEPPRRKPVPADAARISLPVPVRTEVSLAAALMNRRSRREFTPEPLALGELGFLLWSAQGVTSKTNDLPLRTAPSAGGRYPLETYLLALRVAGVPGGVYRYLPESHELVTIRTQHDLQARVVEACYRQAFVGEAAAVIVWAAVPERTEWKYSYLSHRMIAMEAGHACQNLYLASEAVGAGACALLGYDQAAVDSLLGVDGEDEFAIYLVVVGKVEK